MPHPHPSLPPLPHKSLTRWRTPRCPRLLSALLLLVSLTPSTQANPNLHCASHATPQPCALKRGERAPFDGELWPSAFARVVLEEVALGQLGRKERDLAKQELAVEKALRTLDREEATALLEAETKARLKSEALARQMVRAPPWYEHPAFLIPATAALTCGLVMGLSEAIR